MPAQIWISVRNNELLLRTEDGKEHSGPLRLTPVKGVASLKLIVVASCGCKYPLTVEQLPEGSALLEIALDG